MNWTYRSGWWRRGTGKKYICLQIIQLDALLLTRDPLGYLIEQHVLEAEAADDEDFFHTLRDFVYKQIEKIHTVKKVKTVILEPYKELLDWLCVANKNISHSEFAEVFLDFCKAVNRAVLELNP